MKIKNINKLLIIAPLFCVLLFCTSSAFASDYKYKILDTKYNPSAQKILDGTANTEISKKSKRKTNRFHFDFLRFLALIALIVFPILVGTKACKTFKQISEDLKEKGIDYQPEETIPEKKESDSSLEENETTLEKQNNKEELSETDCDEEKETSTKDINLSGVTKPITSKAPVIIEKAKLSKNTGLCLVEYNQKYSLMGYINKKLFLLQKFDKLNQTKIRPRWTESIDSKDRYLVRLGESYKALIEVGNEEINILNRL